MKPYCTMLQGDPLTQFSQDIPGLCLLPHLIISSNRCHSQGCRGLNDGSLSMNSIA